MAKKILAALDALHGHLDHPTLTWDDVERHVRQLPAKTNLVVPKAALGSSPPHGISGRGRKRGALRQFRDGRAHATLHIKEYEAHWVVHVDSWNPHRHLWRHLLVDRGFSQFLDIRGLLAAMTAPRPAPVGA